MDRYCSSLFFVRALVVSCSCVGGFLLVRRWFLAHACVVLCSFIGGFIRVCSVCFVIVHSSSLHLLVSLEGCAL